MILSDPLLAYKYNVIEKPGDALLDEKDFEKVRSFVKFLNSRLMILNIIYYFIYVAGALC